MGADTIRLQVSQFGLDPDSTVYSPAYVQEIRDAVEAARGLGLAVIVSVQAEPPAGENTRCPLPDSGTARVWSELAPMFAGDDNVMFELYNEPAIAANAADWQLWLYGGQVTTASGFSCTAVGVQTLVDQIRGAQAPNVIVVPGLNGEQTLSGMPAVGDPSDLGDPQLAYGIHYPSLPGGIGRWNQQFGRFSTRAPVIVTEWDQNSTRTCTPQSPVQATLLLSYLMSKQIGVVGFAFDLPGTIIDDWSYTPSSYAGFVCGAPTGGPGELLFSEFAGLAQADGPSQVIGAPAWIVNRSAVASLSRLAPAAAHLFFDTPRTYVVGANASTLAALSDPAALPTAKFTSETALATAVATGRLAPGTRAVMFDDEYGKLTPAHEQRTPAIYFSRAAQIAHQAGLLLIAAPSTRLALAHAPRIKPSRLYAEFLRLGIARSVARYADVYAVDAQGVETHPSQYTGFVRSVRSQANGAHPGIELLAGLSTNPNAKREPAQTLSRAALASRTLLAGFYLNDPAGSRATCARCSIWYARNAASFLRGLRSAGG
jgi:hypothetical protein